VAAVERLVPAAVFDKRRFNQHELVRRAVLPRVSKQVRGSGGVKEATRESLHAVDEMPNCGSVMVESLLSSMPEVEGDTLLRSTSPARQGISSDAKSTPVACLPTWKLIGGQSTSLIFEHDGTAFDLGQRVMDGWKWRDGRRKEQGKLRDTLRHSEWMPRVRLSGPRGR
jgi:hypothetical protein